MNLSKKIASWLLVFCMLFSLPVMTHSESEQVMPNVKKLSTLGLIDVSTFEPEKTISRGDFSAMLAVVMGLKITSPEAYGAVFSDVSTDDPNYAAIMYLLKLGVISSDGEFRPNDNITYDEAIKMVVVALGYEIYAKDAGGFPIGYLSVAILNRLIPRNFKSDANGEFTFGKAGELLEFAIDAPMLRKHQYGTVEQATAVEDITILSEFHRIFKVRGILSAVGRRRLHDTDVLIADKIMIDDVSYMNTTAVDHTLLGYYVTGYYQEHSSESDPYIIFLEKDESRNNDLVIEYEKINGFEDNEISYYNADNTRVSTIKIPVSANLMYNYNYVVQYLEEDIVNADKIIFIDSNNDGEYDAVNIIQEETVFVSGVNLTERKIYGKYGESIDLFTPENRKSVSIYTADGQLADISAVTTYCVISVLRDKEEQAVDIYICNEKVSGIVEEIDQADSLVSRKYTVDGAVYQLANNRDKINNLETLSVGQDATLYLNRHGKIAGLQSGAIETKYKFGYAIDIKSGTSFLNNTKIYMFSEDGELKEFSVAERCRINGTLVKDGDDIEQKILDNNLPTHRDKGKINQLIRYKLDGSGKIKDIELSEKFSDEKDLLNETSVFMRYRDLDANYGNRTYSRDSMMFSGSIRIDENTLVMCVPTSEKYKNSEKHYLVRDPRKLTNSTFDVVETYNVKPDRTAGAIVVYTDSAGGTPIQKGTPITIVTSVSQVAMEDGSIRNKINGYRNGAAIELLMAEDCSITQLYGATTQTPTTIERGDMIRAGLNSDGEIYDWYKVFSLKDRDDSSIIYRKNEYPYPVYNFFGSEKKSMIEYKGNATDINTKPLAEVKDIITARVWQHDNVHWFTGVGFSLEFGIVLERYNGNLIIKNFDGKMEKNTTRYLNVTNKTIYIMDEENDRIEIGTLDDIVSADAEGGNIAMASRVIYARYSDVPSFLVVVRRKV